MWPCRPRCRQEIALKPIETFPPPSRAWSALQWGVVAGALALLLFPSLRVVPLRVALGAAIATLWACNLFGARRGDLKLTLPQIYAQFREGRRPPETALGTLATVLSVLAWFVVVT